MEVDGEGRCRYAAGEESIGEVFESVGESEGEGVGGGGGEGVGAGEGDGEGVDAGVKAYFGGKYFKCGCLRFSIDRVKLSN